MMTWRGISHDLDSKKILMLQYFRTYTYAGDIRIIPFCLQDPHFSQVSCSASHGKDNRDAERFLEVELFELMSAARSGDIDYAWFEVSEKTVISAIVKDCGSDEMLKYWFRNQDLINII